MKETSYWERFCTSGAVEDYLRFKAESRNETSVGKNILKTYQKEADSAGLCNDDGNGHKDIARG